MRYLALSVAVALACPTAIFAHGGGLAADGYHINRKNGGRHFHSGGGGSPPPVQRASGGSVNFANYPLARAAGAAPLRAGQAGYGRHLDRDGDGVGCE